MSMIPPPAAELAVAGVRVSDLVPGRHLTFCTSYKLNQEAVIRS